MNIKLGFNVLCKTAKEQYLYDVCRENRQYYEEPFQNTLYDNILEICEKYFDKGLNLFIETKAHVLNDGSVSNAIILDIHSENHRYEKEKMKEELSEYIKVYFETLSEND